MKRVFSRIAVVCAAVTLAGPALATNGMRMTGFGPVQNAMGGVGVGATLDAASIVSNPAGIADLGGRVDFGATYFSPSVDYKATGIGPGLVAKDGVDVSSDRGASPIPVFGLVIPIDSQWTFGLGAYGVAGMGVDYPANLYSSTTYSAYSQMRFTPGLAYKLNDMVSFGLTVNAMWATTEWNVANAFGQVPHPTASAFGIGATVGVKVTPVKMLTIGAAYETKSFFQSFAYNTASGVDKLTFDQPQVLTGGVSVRPIAPLLVAADVEWINWSQTNGQNLPAFGQNSSGAMPWNMNWGNQVVFKVGVEVEATSFLKVRAGYNYGKSPLDPSRAFENIAFPAVAEHHVTGGLGLEITPKFAVNLGFMYAPTVTLSGSNPLPPPGTPSYTGPYGQGILSYQTSMSQFAIDGGIAYKF